MDRKIARPKWRDRRLLWIAGAAALIAAVVAVLPLIPPPGSLTVKASDLAIELAW
jgi:hypothetical protein